MVGAEGREDLQSLPPEARQGQVQDHDVEVLVAQESLRLLRLLGRDHRVPEIAEVMGDGDQDRLLVVEDQEARRTRVRASRFGRTSSAYHGPHRLQGVGQPRRSGRWIGLNDLAPPTGRAPEDTMFGMRDTGAASRSHFAFLTSSSTWTCGGGSAPAMKSSLPDSGIGRGPGPLSRSAGGAEERLSCGP